MTYTHAADLSRHCSPQLLVQVLQGTFLYNVGRLFFFYLRSTQQNRPITVRPDYDVSGKILQSQERIFGRILWLRWFHGPVGKVFKLHVTVPRPLILITICSPAIYQWEFLCVWICVSFICGFICLSVDTISLLKPVRCVYDV